MYCGWKNQAGSPTAPAQSSQVPVVPSAESSTVVATSDASVQSSSLSSLSSSLSSVLESSTTSAESAVLSSIESSDIYSTSSASASDSSSSGHGLFDSDTTDIPGFTSSSGLVVSVSWGVDGSTSYGGTISFSTGIVEVSSGETAQASSTADQSSTTAEETNAADASSSASSSETPVETTSVPSVSEPTDVLTNQSVLSPAPTGGNTGSGLSGPMISSGLEMLLNNGVHLPVTLPDIELPAINLATVHLPDMTFDGIALTAIPLPSVTLPPFNPASLTKFSYIEELMSKAHISFDDLAKLPLPDLHNLDLSHLGGLDANAVMSMVNVNRVSFPRNMVPTPVYIEPENIQQTTTLDASGIDALMGLSIITYSTQ
ncbi:hypothetical protein GGI07_004722 [Coemansia sp. Benny D115]|nr:hypothetical protein GGI07_004722 [Coemansia sp. Benny D115]